MNAMFKEIRHGDIEKVRERIAKNPSAVNEVFTGTKPKKDIGQSPLQVAIKCGEFEIIDLLLENGADTDFMEDQSQKPVNTSASYFMSMSVLHDAIIGTFGCLPYGEFDRSERYVKVIEKLLERGADPNKETSPSTMGECIPPVGTLIREANEILRRYSNSTEINGDKKFNEGKTHLLEVLDLLKKSGADFDRWFDSKRWSGETNRAVFLDDFVPKEDRPYETVIQGKTFTGVIKGDVDHCKVIRAVLQEYFKVK